MLPGAAIGLSEDNIFVNLFEPLSARVELGVGPVQVEVQTEYPFEGVVRVQLGLERPAVFGLCLRKPGWCQSWALLVDGPGMRVPLAPMATCASRNNGSPVPGSS